MRTSLILHHRNKNRALKLLTVNSWKLNRCPFLCKLSGSQVSGKWWSAPSACIRSCSTAIRWATCFSFSTFNIDRPLHTHYRYRKVGRSAGNTHQKFKSPRRHITSTKQCHVIRMLKSELATVFKFCYCCRKATTVFGLWKTNLIIVSQWLAARVELEMSFSGKGCIVQRLRS